MDCFVTRDFNDYLYYETIFINLNRDECVAREGKLVISACHWIRGIFSLHNILLSPRWARSWALWRTRSQWSHLIPLLHIKKSISLEACKSFFFFRFVSVASTPRRAILPTRSHTPSVKFAVNHKKHIKKNEQKTGKKRNENTTKSWGRRGNWGNPVVGTLWTQLDYWLI